jgi:aldose 1-epimerase
MKAIVYFLSLILLLPACNNEQHPGISVKSESWGYSGDREIKLFTLKNSNGMVVKITNYGGIVTSVIVPDKDGNFDDVVLGFDNVDQYIADNPCFGATIGRFANRIGKARFQIGDSLYELVPNNGIHTIHGGVMGFDKQVWEAELFESETEAGIKLHYLSVDGEEGFPGNLDVLVTYTLNLENELGIHFEAETDKPTHANLTHHGYFNLSGVKEKIFNHHIRINASKYLEIDEDIVPTGDLGSVKGELWDLTEMTRMGENINQLDHNGYHYCYVFDKAENSGDWVIEVLESASGRKMEVYTTQPGVQFYSGGNIGDTYKGKYGITYSDFDAFCLETQHFPDTPNHENFPSTLLLPGEKYDETVIYKFSTY